MSRLKGWEALKFYLIFLNQNGMIGHKFDVDGGKRPLDLIKHLKITTYPLYGSQAK